MAITKSQLEIFVDTYLKSLKSHLVKRRDRKFIQKAISMITAITADSPCCSDDTAVIDLHTPYDNFFTNTVRVLLTGVDRRKFGQSIQRVLDKLYNALFDPCCTEEISLTIGGTGANYAVLFSVHDPETNFLLGSITLSNVGENPITRVFTIRKSNVYKYCVKPTINPTSLVMDLVNDTPATLINNIVFTVGTTTCTTTDVVSNEANRTLLLTP